MLHVLSTHLVSTLTSRTLGVGDYDRRKERWTVVCCTLTVDYVDRVDRDLSSCGDLVPPCFGAIFGTGCAFFKACSRKAVQPGVCIYI